MESSRKDPSVAIDNEAYRRQNRLTLEIFLVAALIGIGLPCAILMGARSGEKTAASIYGAAEQGR